MTPRMLIALFLLAMVSLSIALGILVFLYADNVFLWRLA